MDKAFESILLPDKFFAIADLHGLDNCLLDDLDLIALGVLELGEQLVDRRFELADFDAVARGLDGRQVLRKPAAADHQSAAHARIVDLLADQFFRGASEEQDGKGRIGVRANLDGILEVSVVELLSQQDGGMFRVPVVAVEVLDAGQRAHPLETIQVIQVKVEVSLFEVVRIQFAPREMPRLMRDKGTVFAGTTVVTLRPRRVRLVRSPLKSSGVSVGQNPPGCSWRRHPSWGES